MPETPQSVREWADSVFGHASDTKRMVDRAAEEFTELMQAVAEARPDAEIASEMADVCIVLMRAMASLGYDGMIDSKMFTNRARKWKPDGTGHGYHIKEG